MVIHASYLDIWDARRYRVFEERQPMIDIDTYMTHYDYSTQEKIIHGTIEERESYILHENNLFPTNPAILVFIAFIRMH